MIGPMCQHSKLILHSNNLYGKIYTFVLIEMKQVVVEGKKKHPCDTANSLTYIFRYELEKTEKKTKRNADSNQRHRCKEQTLGLSERRQVWDDWRERKTTAETCTLAHVKQTSTSSMHEGGHPGLCWGSSVHVDV